jgi:hypothetical protein
MEVVLTAKQRPDLEQLVAQATAPAQKVRRAQAVLWSARGRWRGNCSLAGVGGGSVADSPPVPRYRGRGLATRRKAGRKDHAVSGR